MPGTSCTCAAGFPSIVDSLVGAPFSTLFFVAAIGAKLRRLASSAASCFLTHRNMGRRSAYSISFTLHQYSDWKCGPCRRQSRSRRPELCRRADQTQAIVVARAQQLLHNAHMDAPPSFPSPAPWMFADHMYGLGNCLIDRD